MVLWPPQVLSFSLVGDMGAPGVGEEWSHGYAVCLRRFLPTATVVTRRRVRAITKAERGPETQSANVGLVALKCGAQPLYQGNSRASRLRWRGV